MPRLPRLAGANNEGPDQTAMRGCYAPMRGCYAPLFFRIQQHRFFFSRMYRLIFIYMLPRS